MRNSFDAIVLGAGAMGSAAAYYLSQRGAAVLLLEQFELDHQRGSSYGYSRIIRYSYDFPEYVELAKDSFPLWRRLQEELGETLYVKTGGIDFGPATDATFQATVSAVRASAIAHELLEPAEAQRRFPQFRFADDFQVLHQPDSGFLKASRAVRGHIQLAQAQGATVMARTAVEAIAMRGDSVAVQTQAGTFYGGKLIVTAGAWSRQLLQQTGIELPLVPLRCQLNFFATGDIDMYQAEACPVWIGHVASLFPETVYGIPAHGGSGFKAAFHGGPPISELARVDYQPGARDVDSLREFLSAHIPGLAAAPVQESRICLYTRTPDEHFIVDAHPEHSQIAIGAGFSGHGFKFSTTIGKMLAEIALDGATAHNNRLFKIERFIA